jgi:hypothetical protein
MNKTEAVYVDPAPLAKYVVWAIWVQIAFGVVSLISDGMEYSLLNAMNNGTISGDTMMSQANANDARQQVIAIVNLMVLLGTAFLVLKWIFRADKNLHARNVPGLTFTPGWCVGWFFVPIAGLWKPYQAMKEIWSASLDPANRSVERPAMLPLWWALYLISNFAGVTSARLALTGTSIDMFLVSSGLSMVSAVMSIPEAIVLILIVKQITEAQGRIPELGEAPAPSPVPSA